MSTAAQQAAARGTATRSRVLTYGLTLLVAAVVMVELVNILFYDPYGDSYFLFRLQGVLANVSMSAPTWIMFGSLFVLLMAGLPLAFVAGVWAWCSSTCLGTRRCSTSSRAASSR